MIPGARLAAPFNGVPRADETRLLVETIRDFVNETAAVEVGP
jgi:hypothetical protein